MESSKYKDGCQDGRHSHTIRHIDTIFCTRDTIFVCTSRISRHWTNINMVTKDASHIARKYFLSSLKVFWIGNLADHSHKV